MPLPESLFFIATMLDDDDGESCLHIRSSPASGEIRDMFHGYGSSSGPVLGSCGGGDSRSPQGWCGSHSGCLHTEWLSLPPRGSWQS